MWKLFFRITILTLTLNVFAAARVQSGCSIKLPDDIKGFAPVILVAKKSKEFQLFKPTGAVTRVKTGSQLLLVCTGNKNVFADRTFKTLQLRCLQNNFVDSDNNVQPLNGLECKSIPSSTLRMTTNECSHGKGFIYESGFMVEDQFYGPVFEICYNNITETTFYTHHTLNGAAINYSIPESSRRAFSADGMQFTTSKVNRFYTKKHQVYTFEKLLGPHQTYLDEKNFLARGHLTPDADFILPYEQLSTYYYANVAPEFQAVNAGNWLRVEELARAIAASYKDYIETYTSYVGVLALTKSNGDSVNMYLDDRGKLEVPHYYFKVLLHRASDSAIVFVSVNNPYIANGAQQEICTNVCKQTGLEHANFADVTKGYTFCCELNEFKLLLDTLPNEVKASRLLKRKKYHVAGNNSTSKNGQPRNAYECSVNFIYSFCNRFAEGVKNFFNS